MKSIEKIIVKHHFTLGIIIISVWVVSGLILFI